MDKDWTQPMWLSQPHKYENFASNIKESNQTFIQ